MGGPHKCNIHLDFPETDDVNVWNQHCRETEGHDEFGTRPCFTCKAPINFGTMPHQDIGAEVKLQCQKCFNESNELNRLVLEQNKQEEQK